jgi:hypothetical protein
MFDVQEADANRDWIAHYAAVKARIARKPVMVREDIRRYRQIYLCPIGPVMPMSIKMYREDVAKQASNRLMARTNARKILEQICAEFDISMNDLLSPRRDKLATSARKAAYWRLKNETQWSLPQIGRLMKKDHTTVLHGLIRFQLEALHKHLGLRFPTNNDFLLFQKSDRRASTYIAAREVLQ